MRLLLKFKKKKKKTLHSAGKLERIPREREMLHGHMYIFLLAMNVEENRPRPLSPYFNYPETQERRAKAKLDPRALRSAGCKGNTDAFLDCTK